MRQARGLSQVRLAELSHVSQAYISELEAGDKQPTITILKRLASALGVSVAELLGEDERPTGTEGNGGPVLRGNGPPVVADNQAETVGHQDDPPPAA